MSLLSNLIANLSALVGRSVETQAHLHGATDQLERAFDTARQATVGSTSAHTAEALGQLRNSIGKLDDAQQLLRSGDEHWQDYIAVLNGGAAATSGGRAPSRPPLPAASEALSDGAKPVRGPAKHGVRPPTPGRHQLARIGRSSQPAEKNTIILPSVDVDGDLEAIRTGRAQWNPATNRYEVSGRSWGVEPNGTAFPASGPGLITLTRSQFKALKDLNTAGQPVGVWPKSHLKDPSISPADWDRAAEVYRYHPRHSQGAS